MPLASIERHRVDRFCKERLAAYVHQAQVDPLVVQVPHESAVGAQALILEHG